MRRPRLASLVLLGACAGASSGTAPSGAPTASADPAPRAHHALAYDERAERVVLFGGSAVVDSAPHNLDDYQEWDGSRWSRPVATTLRRTGARMVFDAERDRLLLIAGMDGSDGGATYRWNGRRWTPLVPEPTIAVTDPAVTYDRHRGRAVVYGGARADGQPSADFWELDGDLWRRIPASGPGPLSAAEWPTTRCGGAWCSLAAEVPVAR